MDRKAHQSVEVVRRQVAANAALLHAGAHALRLLATCARVGQADDPLAGTLTLASGFGDRGAHVFVATPGQHVATGCRRIARMSPKRFEARAGATAGAMLFLAVGHAASRLKSRLPFFAHRGYSP